MLHGGIGLPGPKLGEEATPSTEPPVSLLLPPTQAHTMAFPIALVLLVSGEYYPHPAVPGQ